MSNITIPISNETTYNRRQIHVGPISTTFTAVTAGPVEVNCWGGGGNGGETSGGTATGGGGGGGYVRYVYELEVGDQLDITVGGATQTSSVSCPTQSPTSPISASGGANGARTFEGGGSTQPGGNVVPGGSGGTGTGTVPSSRTGYLLTRSGGDGSPGNFAPSNTTFYGGGGGSAGHEHGDGVNNTNPPTGPAYYRNVIMGGAGIGGAGVQNPGPGATQTFTTSNPRNDSTLPTPFRQTNYTHFGKGGPGIVNSLGAPPTYTEEYVSWFSSKDQKAGQGGNGVFEYAPFPSPTSYTRRTGKQSGTKGGFLAGGAGGFRINPSPRYYNLPYIVGWDGGYAGGGGGSGGYAPSYPTTVSYGRGGAGIVIIYFNI